MQNLKSVQRCWSDTDVLWPWRWERVHWWSWSAVTHAAGRPDVIRALSAGWKCRRGRWRCRAVHSKRRRGRRCKTKLKARGWVHASQCSRLCRKARRCNVPSVPGALLQTQRRNTTLQPPGGAHVKRRSCYLIRKEIEVKKKMLFISLMQCWHRQRARHSPWLGKQTLRQQTKDRAVRLVKLHRPNSTPHIA